MLFLLPEDFVLRDFLRDLKNRVPPPPFKVLILQGFRDFGRLTSTFDSHHPRFIWLVGVACGPFVDVSVFAFAWLES